MDWTTHHNRTERLAFLLREVRAFETEELTTDRDLMEEIRGALAVAPSDHPLERELYDLLKCTVELPGTVGTYDVDRALAEAERTVDPGGAIEYQYRWQQPSGEWSHWHTWRTRDTMDAPIPDLPDGKYIQFRIAPALV